MADMTLSADINADVSGFTSGISKAESSTESFKRKCQSVGSSAQGAGDKVKAAGDDVGGFSSKCKGAGSGASGLATKFSTLKVAAGNLAADLAGRAIDAVMSLGSEMVAASDSADKFRSTLEFSGIDSGTIDSLVQSTQAYADQTVYDLADIRNATAQLAANGVDNYAQLAEAAGNLNAVAGGNADTFKSVSMVMSQTAGSGKLMTENWNQLTDAIPGASGALQDAMREAGAFEGNFREAMENGEISADEFFAAVQKLGMTDVAREAATSTSTIEGAVGNLQAAFVGVGSQVVDAFKPFITGAATQAAEMVTGVGTALGIAADYALNWNSIAAEASTEMGRVATAGDMAALMLQEIGMAFGVAPAQMAPFGDALATVVDSVQGMATAFMSAFQSVLPAVQNLATTVGPLLLPLIQQISSVVAAMAPVIATVATTVLNVATQIGAVVIPILTQIYAFIASNMPTIQTIVTNAMTAIQTVVTSVLNIVQTIWNAVWPAIQVVVETVMGVINGVITTVLGIIQNDWGTVWEGIQQVAQSVWDGISGIVEGAISAVQGCIDGALSTIQSAWDSAWSSVQEVLSSAWESIKSGVSSGVESVLGFFRDLPGNILGALGDVGSLLWDAGSSIINGLLNGIESAIGGVYDFVSGIAGTIASLKGPIPYDRKLLIPAGNAIMDGLLRGLTTGFRAVRREVSGMAGGLAREVSSSVGGMGARLEVSGTAASVALGGAVATGRYATSDSVAEPVAARPQSGRTVYQNITNRIVRTNDDLYVAAAIMSRSNLSAAMGV